MHVTTLSPSQKAELLFAYADARWPAKVGPLRPMFGGVVLLEFKLFDGKFHLDAVLVGSDWRGNGFGRRALRTLQAAARQYDCTMHGKVEPFGWRPPLGLTALKKWYIREGWKVSRNYYMTWTP